MFAAVNNSGDISQPRAKGAVTATGSASRLKRSPCVLPGMTGPTYAVVTVARLLNGELPRAL